MNRKELVKEVAEKTKMTITDVEKCIKNTEKVILEELKQGNEIRFYGFGKFSTRAYKARTMTTAFGGGKVVNIPAGIAAKFSPGKMLKEALNK